VVIIGGGMAGLSCAASLARKGVSDVMLLEANSLAHAQASSFGETRMFREMYSDPVLCSLAQEANRLWALEEIQAGESLRASHGLLFYGESWDEETIEGSIPGARRVMDDQGIPYEALNAEQIAARFPLKPKTDFTGLFEPSAGAVRSNRVIAHWTKAAKTAGHHLLEHTPVQSLDANGGGVTLASGHHISAEQVVVACGIWSQSLLHPLGLAPKLEIWPMLWAHYTVDPTRAEQYPQWFCFQRERGDDGGLYYGFPVLSHTSDGKPLAGMAGPAVQMGGWVAADIVAKIQGQAHKAFTFTDFGTMAVLGPLHAVADLRGLKVSGLPGWILWGLAHLMFMPANENRLTLLTKWLWAIATRQRASMLITGRPNQHLNAEVGLERPTPAA